MEGVGWVGGGGGRVAVRAYCSAVSVFERRDRVVTLFRRKALVYRSASRGRGGEGAKTGN